MTISRTSLVALALALTIWGAQAQTDDNGDSHAATAPPKALSGAPPSGDDQPPDVDTSDLKSDEPEPAQGNIPAAQGGDTGPLIVPLQHKTKIEVETLGTPDGPVAGLLDASNGGLDANMWTGSSREQVEALLARVPLASSDTAVRALARRLILTKADAPAGSGTRALATIRVEKLLDAGMIDEAAALAVMIHLKDDADFARVQAEAILVAGRAADACGDLTASRLTEGDLFWLQLRAYCAAASGDAATAELTRNVMDAEGQGDTAYNILVDDALTGAKKSPGLITKPTALHVFLLRKAGLPVTGDTSGKLGAAANLLALRDKANSPELRLKAAERIVRTGAASIAELRAVADAQAISSDRLANPMTAASKEPFLAGQALLRRAAQLESRPGIKAELVHQALVLGDKAGLFEVAARLQADIAVTVEAKAAPHDLAPVMSMALLLAGKPEAASHWLADSNTARVVFDLVAGKDAAPADLGAIADDLTAAQKAQNPNQPFEALVLGAYDALGLAMPPEAQAAAKAAAARQWPGRGSRDADTQLLIQAAAAPDRKGEAVLRILDVVGAKGPGDLAPDLTVELIRTLRQMGLNADARSLAIHALLLYRPAAP